jgi:NAD(P)H dehydrogenase (quinone)
MGMTVVGLDYGFRGQVGVSEVLGGSPYGATTISDVDGSRQPHAEELEGARYLGQKVATTAAKLKARLPD